LRTVQTTTEHVDELAPFDEVWIGKPGQGIGVSSARTAQIRPRARV
jgi:hypothetical protein